MMKSFALFGLALSCISVSAVAIAGPVVCLDTITDVELVHRIKQDAYFMHHAAPGRSLRIEYDGCGYRIHVSDGSPNARRGDLLLVDRHGRVTQVIHQ